MQRAPRRGDERSEESIPPSAPTFRSLIKQLVPQALAAFFLRTNSAVFLRDTSPTAQAILVECTTYVDTEWLLSLLKASELLDRR